MYRRMLEHNPGSASLSTDEYFCRHGDYRYDPSELSAAHEWNQKRGTDIQHILIRHGHVIHMLKPLSL